MRGLCKHNKMINCLEQTKCAKCTWNPEYFEAIKQKSRVARKSAKEKSIKKEMQL